MKKRVDERVRQLLVRAYETHTRALFFVVGDHAKDQVPFFYHLLTRIGTRPRPDVLWMYKKELGFSSHRRKRLRQLRKKLRHGGVSVDAKTEDLFELFVSTANIRFSYYSESEKVLGNTYGLLVLQDFGALTPNLLARTIETVQGGGLVLFLLHNMESLRQLYTLKMDVHAHYRTESCPDIVPRFNRRLVLSLETCPMALAVDDELNVLPAVGGASCSSAYSIPQAANADDSSRAQDLASIPRIHVRSPPEVGGTVGDSNVTSEAEFRQKQLEILWSSRADLQVLGPLLRRTRTLDQARVLETLHALLARNVDTTTPAALAASMVVLTAARGRGKSAALGLAAAAALALGYTSIVVTAPAADNVQTLFSLLVSGLNELKLQEHTDYVLESRHDRCISKLSMLGRRVRQVSYLEPEAIRRVDAATIGALVSADLVIIDEAAAIPLVLVKRILSLLPSKSCHVFLSSTIFGYEGTGRSLSLKLIAQARRHVQQNTSVAAESRLLPPPMPEDVSHTSNGGIEPPVEHSCDSGTRQYGRRFHELVLEEPIRYARNDPVEAWLHALLCLETTEAPALQTRALPHPSMCMLCQVNRDVLFSGHALAEIFLRRVMALFVSSHYKNTPNDLQMLSDASNQQLYVLLGPTSSDPKRLPDVLCAIQLGLEGRLSREHTESQLSRGKRAAGDLIPWTLTQQFQETAFAQLAGARVIRIATHPDVQGMGYGTRAMECLVEHFRRRVASGVQQHERKTLRETDDAQPDLSVGSINDDTVPEPLLYRLGEQRVPDLDYLGVSFGLSHGLYRFWNRIGMLPVYVRLTPNEVTAEHTCIMLRSLKQAHEQGFRALHLDWRARFLSLLSYDFRSLPLGLVLDVLRAAPPDASLWNAAQLRSLLSMHDLRRLQAYANHLLDYHVILDIIPVLSRLYFEGHFAAERITLSPAQQAILVGVGLQRRPLEELGAEMQVESAQLLALFGKICRKFANEWKRLAEEEASTDLPLHPITERAASSRNGDVSQVAAADHSSSSTSRQLTRSQQTLDSLRPDSTSYVDIGGKSSESRPRFALDTNMQSADSGAAPVRLVSLPARRS